MYPFIDLYFFKIGSYSLMVCLGMISYVIYLSIAFKRNGYSQKHINKLLLISILFFIILFLSALIMNSIFHSIEKGYIVIGGITWLGGVIISFPCMIYLIYHFIPEFRGNTFKIFSLIVPGIVLAHAFGRVGCFLGGCCYGEPTLSILGVSFPPGSLAAIQYPDINGWSVKVLPVQLFEAIFEFLLFVVIILFNKKNNKYNYEIYGVTYSIYRFIIEYFRGDNRGATGIYFSPSQLMCIILFMTVILVFLYRKK